MKVLFSACRNPHFPTITEYIERALDARGCEVRFFDNRRFFLPGRVRDRCPPLHRWDLRRLNRDLLETVENWRPDLFLETGGHRILPETVRRVRELGTKAALWTIDAPVGFDPVLRAAPFYDDVWTGGSEAYEILEGLKLRSLHWLPFGCDPEIHRPEAREDAAQDFHPPDVAFVGTLDPVLYPRRVRFLEAISDFNLGVWGPGARGIPRDSPLRKRIRGEEAGPERWRKIYSRAKISVCLHYRDPDSRIPCRQASPRVFEVLACGGFLLVDDQPDVERLFVDGEDLLVFRNVEELRGLLRRFLDRPSDRERIAQTGRRKVLAAHTYGHRVEEILKRAGGP